MSEQAPDAAIDSESEPVVEASAESDVTIDPEAGATTAQSKDDAAVEVDLVVVESGAGSDDSAASDDGEATEPVDPPEPDEVLLGSRELAREALTEITDAQTIGVDEGYEVHESHVLTLYFECRMPGYPGWRWAATLARVGEDSPVNVLEVELLPGEGSVIAPEWVPWSVRLAQYREAQAKQVADEAAAAEAAAAELSDEDDVEPEDDVLENDFSDFEDEIDGVDIDEEDDSDDDSDDDSEDDDADEDGFSDIDEHDLHDHSDDEVDFESEEEE